MDEEHGIILGTALFISDALESGNVSVAKLVNDTPGSIDLP